MRHWLVAAVSFFLAHAAFALPVTQAKVYTARGVVPLTLEVASNANDRATGLMKRKTLAPFDGMLFAWPQSQDASFWMKNTMIPLDILFVDAQGKVRHVAPMATPYSLEPISSGGPYLTAIEIDGGRAAKAGITAGSRVEFMLPAELRVE